MTRADRIGAILDDASALALQWFARRASLAVDEKPGRQLVSEADRDVERAIRAGIARWFPDDAVLQAFNATCASLGNGAETAKLSFPSDGGASYSNGINCGGRFAVGVTGGHGALIDRLGLICEDISARFAPAPAAPQPEPQAQPKPKQKAPMEIDHQPGEKPPMEIDHQPGAAAVGELRPPPTRRSTTSRAAMISPTSPPATP